MECSSSLTACSCCWAALVVVFAVALLVQTAARREDGFALTRWLAPKLRKTTEKDPYASRLLGEIHDALSRDPLLSPFFAPLKSALTRYGSFEAGVAAALGQRLRGRGFTALDIQHLCLDALKDSQTEEYGHTIAVCLRADGDAVVERDPAADSLLEVVLHYKGFAALAAHRIARIQYLKGHRHLALWFQSRVSEICGVDIHPLAEISKGVMLDHATGVVIGETAKIDEGCTLLHSCTLGATGKDKGDRHPKIGKYVLLGAGVSVLGNIKIGDGAKIGAGSVVLRPVPSGATAVGAPAKIVGRAKESKPSEALDNGLHAVMPRPGAEDVACVWRDIAKRAEPKSHHIGVHSFSKALGTYGVDETQSYDLFFQLDTDQDGLVSRDDLPNEENKFKGAQKVAKFCSSCSSLSSSCSSESSSGTTTPTSSSSASLAATITAGDADAANKRRVQNIAEVICQAIQAKGGKVTACSMSASRSDKAGMIQKTHKPGPGGSSRFVEAAAAAEKK